MMMCLPDFSLCSRCSIVSCWWISHEKKNKVESRSIVNTKPTRVEWAHFSCWTWLGLSFLLMTDRGTSSKLDCLRFFDYYANNWGTHSESMETLDNRDAWFQTRNLIHILCVKLSNSTITSFKGDLGLLLKSDYWFSIIDLDNRV